MQVYAIGLNSVSIDYTEQIIFPKQVGRDYSHRQIVWLLMRVEKEFILLNQ